MSVFERAPLLPESNICGKNATAEGGDGEKLIVSRKSSSKSKKDYSSWRTKTVMIGTTALIFGAAVAQTTRTVRGGGGGGIEDDGSSSEGNLGAIEGSSSSSSSSTADVVTLTLGCTSSATLDLLPFPNGGFVGKVGAKLSLKSKDHNFGFQHAIDMAEIGCGTYAVAHKLEEGEQFGFYLYDVKNETNYLSDIGAQAIEGGPISEGARNAAVWGAETELAAEENASDRKRLEDGIDNIARQQSLKTNAAAVAYAGKHGFIDPDGNFVAKATAENAKAFEDAQSKGWWPEFSSTTDSETGVTSMN